MKILNRIVVFVLSLAIFPVMFTRNIVRAVVAISQDSSIYTILSKLMKESINNAMELTISVKEFFQYLSEGKFSFAGMDFSLSKIPSEMLSGKGWAISAGILIVIALIVAMVIMGCAIFTKAYKTIMSLSAGGAVLTFAAMRCFARFAVPYINGTVNLGSILAKSLIGEESGILGALGSSILDGAISVNAFHLDSAVSTMLILFIGIFLWSVAYYVTMPQEKKTKEKK